MNQLPLTPEPKRQRVEEAADGNGCKHCACKKSKSLKLYCPCFAGGGYCSDKCGCLECFNKHLYANKVQITHKVLLSRQKRMSLKINRRSEANAEAMEDAQHSSSSTPPKRGCSCKKSSCLKKYCGCYQDGTGCSLFCRCEDCRNPFGKNEGLRDTNTTPPAGREPSPAASAAPPTGSIVGRYGKRVSREETVDSPCENGITILEDCIRDIAECLAQRRQRRVTRLEEASRLKEEVEAVAKLLREDGIKVASELHMQAFSLREDSYNRTTFTSLTTREGRLAWIRFNWARQ
ncbi:hypothetical protein ACP4OV_028677 [Aristida adscensionis]